MKFVIATRPLGNLPPEAAGPLFQAAKQWLSDKTKEGIIDAVYGYQEGGGLTIANADSHEDLMNTVRGFPLFPFVAWEIRPLVDINKSLDSAVEMFQKMTAQRV